MRRRLHLTSSECHTEITVTTLKGRDSELYIEVLQLLAIISTQNNEESSERLQDP